MAAVWVTSPALGLKLRTLSGYEVAGEFLERFERDTGLCDFYVVCNGRVVGGDEPLQNGSVYHLEPRLRGGKGGFGSMLRALGAQIEKTTNREACRDLSGRRLRDVNHEKEMADWLKKQAEREAEKEQRRLERLQKKLAEPKHHFTDSKYTQQCHELSERLEDSVIKGLQASSSSAVRPEATKRPSEERDGPESKRNKSSFTWRRERLNANAVGAVFTLREAHVRTRRAQMNSSKLRTGLDLDSDEDSDTDQSTGSEETEPMRREAEPMRRGAEPMRRGAEPMRRGAESEDSGQSSSSPAPSEGQSTGARPSPGPSSRPDPERRPEGEPQTRPESSCGAEGDPESRPESSSGAERDPESRPEPSCGAERDPESRPEPSCGAERDPESRRGAERDPESRPEPSCGAERDPVSRRGAERDPESRHGAERDPVSRPKPSCGAERDPESRPEPSCGAERDPVSRPKPSYGAERDPESRPQAESSPDEVQTKPESSSSPDQDESQEQRPLDLDSFSRAEDLEALGLNALKGELMRRGLKCGGTLSERAARLFSVRGKREGDIDRALIAKNAKKKHK